MFENTIKDILKRLLVIGILIISALAILSTFLFPIYKKMPIGFVPVIFGLTISVLVYRFPQKIYKFLDKSFFKIPKKHFLTILCFLTIFVRLPWIFKPGTPISDYLGYYHGAKLLLKGFGFGSGIVYPPFPKCYVAIAFLLFGESARAVSILNTICSLMAVLLIYFLFNKSDEKISRLSSIIAALFPSMAVYTGSLGYENFLFFMLPLMLYFIKRDNINFANNGEILSFWIVIFGLACGIVSLTHPPYVLLPFFALIGLWIGGLSFRVSLIKTIISFSLMLAVIAPWTYRNYIIYQEFCLISANGGYVLLSSNNPHSDGIYCDFDTIYPKLPGENNIAYDKRCGKIATRNIISDPIRFISLSIKRISYMWGTDTSSLGCVLDERPKAKLFMSFSTQVYWSMILFFWFIWSLKYFSIKEFQPSYILIAILLIFHKFAIHMLLEPISRHHLDILPILAFFAASGFLALSNRNSKRFEI